MNEAKKIVSAEEQFIINAGGEVNSFYDVFHQFTDEELKEYKKFAGIPEESSFEETLKQLKEQV